ncbi:hypothetical protein BRADI_5g23390v3 [Brachypodium distachyon]|uniref:Uncharacterized protein n=1 Tax=Brachypodium distachyon TaxID=15368 RepID=A0A0Q3KXJ2_BRADI|nr:hypothetical protein BRADI_5g23390v3 [Brachypodium distachyon]
MSPVRIIESSHVAVPATAALPQEPIKLTAMEAVWVVLPVLQHVLLYDLGADMPRFDAILQSLRSSLAETLRSFAPLAGKLVHLEATGDFVVAESDADIGRLVEDEEHDLRVLERLVPVVDMSRLPTALLAVQATRFDGGLAVGITVHHAAWAAACRGETPSMAAAAPSFDRSLVKLPNGEELARSVLRDLAPNLPLATTPPSVVEDRTRFTRRTFTLDSPGIQRLKQQILHLGESHGLPLSRPPSVFAAVMALVWTSFARCKPSPSDNDNDDVPLFFFADVRDRLDPPVSLGYIGACLTACLAKLPRRELHSERALAAAAAAVQDEVRKMKEDPVAGHNFLRPEVTDFMDRLMLVSGSSGFRAYEVADFGWGKPRRTEPIRMNHDGQVALMRARDGSGVQVSVSMLQPVHMDEFKSHFHKLLGYSS